MLKIKDNVNLDELEKFGFRKSPEIFNYIYDYTIGNILTQIKVYEDRHIEVSQEILYIWNNQILEKIYDLIKANLIEKVEDK